MEHFYLYGPSGVGKSASGRILADSLDYDFYDLDLEIESRAGMPVDAIFDLYGEAHFREVETQMLAEVAGNSQPSVIALGGGTLLKEENLALSKSTGRVLVLRAELSTLLGRLESSKTARPLLKGDPAESLRAYLADRQAHYDSFERQLQTDTLSTKEIAWTAQKIFGAFRLKQMGRPYDVRVLRGGLSEIGMMLKEHGRHGSAIVVADVNTEIYGEKVTEALRKAGFSASCMVIPAGETHKTVDTVRQLWSAFLEHGLDRGSTCVAVGGGVVGDLAGFAAATYLRGIDWVSVPTTLLAMVDASIGGKTGADLPEGKNLVGAFHAPALVFIDPELLATLPARELRAGMAEVVKAAVIADPLLFEKCLTWDYKDDLSEIIPAAAAVKIGIIESDPFEQGERALLNFGHTIGHAVEHASGFELLHGEAIAIGMHLESKLSVNLGIAKEATQKVIGECLHRLGLPGEIPDGLSRRQIIATMQLDKKKSGGELVFALPERVGAARLIQVPRRDYAALFK